MRAPAALDVAQLLPAGSSFGPYLVERPIGAGVSSVVYRVRKGRLQRVRALKVLRAELAGRPELVARFAREGYALAAVRDPNVVAVEDVGSLDGRHFLEMELLEGSSLAHALRERPRWSLEDALDVVLPVASGLHAAHTSPMRLVHRDLAPRNILLATTPSRAVVPKLIDFGVAHVAADDMTEVGQVLGSPNYMSPEQVCGARGIDGRADQWGLAVVLFQMLTGRCPFAMPSAVETGMCIVLASTPGLRDNGVALAPRAEAVILAALSKRPDERFPSMRAFGLALAPYARPETRARFEARWSDDPAEEATHLRSTPPREEQAPRPASPPPPAATTEVSATTLPQQQPPAPTTVFRRLDEPLRPVETLPASAAESEATALLTRSSAVRVRQRRFTAAVAVVLLASLSAWLTFTASRARPATSPAAATTPRSSP